MKLPFFGSHDKEKTDAPQSKQSTPGDMQGVKPILGQTQKLPSIATPKGVLGSLGQTQKVSASDVKRGIKPVATIQKVPGNMPASSSLQNKIASSFGREMTASRPPSKQVPGQAAEAYPTRAIKPTGVFFCPICEIRMDPITYGETTYFHCDQCQGYWCPGNTFSILASQLSNNYNRFLLSKLQILLQSRLEAELDIQTNHSCPKCRHPLALRHYKKVIGVAIEPCKQQCGTFISQTMLEKVQILTRIVPDKSPHI